MPGGDRTGPHGEGPATGRGMGPCIGGQGQRWMGAGPQGRVRGRGRGLRFWRTRQNTEWPAAEAESASEVQVLRERTRELERQLADLSKRLEELSK